jgi:hypothetical protein
MQGSQATAQEHPARSEEVGLARTPACNKVCWRIKGALYGTTFYGGISSSDCSFDGCGAVFKLMLPRHPGGSNSENDASHDMPEM